MSALIGSRVLKDSTTAIAAGQLNPDKIGQPSLEYLLDQVACRVVQVAARCPILSEIFQGH